MTIVAFSMCSYWYQ